MSDRRRRDIDEAAAPLPARRPESAPEIRKEAPPPAETQEERRARIDALRARRALRERADKARPAFELSPIEAQPAARRSIWPTLLGFLALVLVPTALAAGYYWGIAADRYVTEVRYSVRGGAAMASGGEGGGMGASAALIVAGDSFVLEDYLASPEAVLDIEARTPLREMLARDGGDPVRGFDPEAPIEDLVGYWESAVRPRFDAVTGITTVEIAMFRPEDAAMVGEALVAELGRIVDSLSAQQRREMLAYVNGEVERAKRELDAARDAIETFRRSNRIITPEEEVTIGSSVMSALSNRLAETRVDLRALQERAPSSPRIPELRDRVASLEAQIDDEVAARQEGEDAALPAQITGFESLQADYEIARETYVATLALKQEAEAYATLGQAELVVFVPPRPPILSTEPNRALEVLKVFAIAFAVWLALRIVLASLRT